MALFKRAVEDGAMKTVYEHRRDNLQALIDEVGSAEQVANMVDSSAVYLSQIRTMAKDKKTGRPRTMGDKMARRLEASCGRASGWMDQAHPAPELQPHAGGIGVAETPPAAYGRTANALAGLVDELRAVPRQQRNEVASRLAALALAPDSAELIADLTDILRHARADSIRKQRAA